jgi:hypothetical protein
MSAFTACVCKASCMQLTSASGGAREATVEHRLLVCRDGSQRLLKSGHSRLAAYTFFLSFLLTFS